VLLRVRTDERMPSPRLLAEPVRRPFHDVKQRTPSRSRARIAASGLCLFGFAHPHRGGAERRETFGCLRDTRWTCRNAARQALARRLASHDAGRSPLGAPPWRFWAPGAALPSPWAPAALQRRAGAVQRAPRTQVVVPGGRGPCLPRRAVTSRRRRTPRLAPPSGSSPETPLDERGWEAM